VTSCKAPRVGVDEEVCSKCQPSTPRNWTGWRRRRSFHL